jgi:hypothetical protein
MPSNSLWPPFCDLLHRQRAPSLERPRIPPTGVGCPRRSLLASGSRNQREEDKDGDLHTREDPHSGPGGVLPADAERLGSSRGLGQLESAVSTML